jgi:hypothetical protein
VQHPRASALATTALLLAALTGCGGSSGGKAQATASPSADALAVPAPSVIVIDPQVPLTQTYRTTTFRPPLTLKLPADWYPTERDVDALQVYAGDEEHEITFDHTYKKKESVDAAIARLKKTEGLVAGPVSPVSIGDRHGLGFVGKRDGLLRLTFADSGFHVPGGSDLEIMAIPLEDGTTLTVYVTRRVGDGAVRPLEPTRQLARRILGTVQWR